MCDTCRSENPATHGLHTVSFQPSRFCSEEPNPSRARGPLLGNTHGIKVAIYTGQNFFSLLLSPHRGGSCHHIRPQRRRGRSGNFPSARALRTDLSRPHTHAQPPSTPHPPAPPPPPPPPPPSFTHTKARASRAISRQYCVRPGPAAPGSYSVRNFPPSCSLMKSERKKEGRGWCVVVRVPQSPPPFWWRERV